MNRRDIFPFHSPGGATYHTAHTATPLLTTQTVCTWLRGHLSNSWALVHIPCNLRCQSWYFASVTILHAIGLSCADVPLRIYSLTVWRWHITTNSAMPTQPSIPPGSANEDQLRLGRKRQVWFIPLADKRGVCRCNCEIPWEHVSYLSALEACSRRGAIQIHVYLHLTLPLPRPIEEQQLDCCWNDRAVLQKSNFRLRIYLSSTHSVISEIAVNHILSKSEVFGLHFCHR